MPVTSQLTSLIDFSGTPTLPGYGGGSGASVNDDVIIEGAQSAGRRVDNSINKGFGGAFTAADISGAGEHIKVWLFVTQWAEVTQVQIRISSGADDDHIFPASEYPPLGGFVPVWVDVSRTPESGGSANEAAINEVGVLLNIGDVGGNASNLILDEIMHGTSGLQWTGTGGGFSDFRSYEETNNEGNLVPLSGVDFCYSRLEIGANTADTFTDSGFTLIFPDQSLVADTFMGVTLRGTDSLSNGTIGSSNPVGASKRPDLICLGAQTLSGLNLPGLRVVDLNSTSTLNGGSRVISSGLVRQLGGTLDSVSVANSTATTALEIDDASKVSNLTLTGNNIAIDATAAIVADEVTIDGCTFSGNTTDITVNSANDITLNMVNGSNATTCTNTGAGSCTIVNSKTYTVTGLVAGSEVRIFTDTGNNATDVELGGVESSGTSFTYAYSYSSDQPIRVVIHSLQEQYIEFDDTLTADNKSIPVNQRTDRNYLNA